MRKMTYTRWADRSVEEQRSGAQRLLDTGGRVCARDAARILEADYSRVLRLCRDLGLKRTGYNWWLSRRDVARIKAAL